MAKKTARLQPIDKDTVLLIVAAAVFLNGAIILLGVLSHIGHLPLIRRLHVSEARTTVNVIIGVSLIYLSTLLNRRKQTAWLITLLVYGFLLGVSVSELVTRHFLFDQSLGHFVSTIALPLLILASLTYYRDEFNVKSDVRNFTVALRFTIIVLLVTFLYGVLGFTLLDKRDFHREIKPSQAAHYTVDQFNVTTGQAVVAYTDRGKLFLQSLTIVSITSLAYAAIALFQPLRARLSDQRPFRDHIEQLLNEHGGSSEDFFKVWPHDKTYFISADGQSALAYHVERGVALVVGDPLATPQAAFHLHNSFYEMCRTNDWLPAFIHTEPKWSSFYKHQGYSLQKIGEEAVVSLEHFLHHTAKEKYFRQIMNKFNRIEYSSELLMPPHKSAVIERLQTINQEWLNRAGHDERGLMMGYFSADYLQLCPLLVARDAAGTIQAFLNQIPSFDKQEANFDMLRFADTAPGNINDYLLVQFIHQTQADGFKRLNLGLSPLAGIADEEDEGGVITNVLKIVYSYGDRFYSFSGLHKFKSKYEPQWQDRFIAYRGGIRGFTRTVNALNRAMIKSVKRPKA